MDDSVAQFYDRLSGDYHLLFEDWQTWVRRQAEVLDGLLRAQSAPAPSTILDCCCGIGSQAIGLATRGYEVQGTDLSPAAIERAQREARAWGVSVRFDVADVRTLGETVAGTFDVVLACDNALPHLLSDDDLQRAVNSMAARLRPGGVFLASTRDYDAMVRERPRATAVRVFEDPGERRLVFQVWDWRADGRCYQLHQFMVRGAGQDWRTSHYTTWYRALLRQEVDEALCRAGLTDIRWHMPADSGYHQPLVTARKTG
jgi:glycine/sarcosine N-methyltransferase